MYRHDVGVVQGRGGARLALKPAHAFAVSLKSDRQQLERDLAAELQVLRQIHLAHGPTPNPPDYLEMAKHASREWLVQNSLRGFADHGVDEGSSSLTLRGEQRCHFRPDIGGGDILDEGGAVAWRKLHRFV